MIQRTMRQIILIFILGSNEAFQSHFKIHFLPVWERHDLMGSRIVFAYQASKGRRHANLRRLNLLNSENDTGNDHIHVGSLGSTDDVDVIQSLEDSLPDDVREELDLNQPSELSVLKNVRYQSRLYAIAC